VIPSVPLSEVAVATDSDSSLINSPHPRFLFMSLLNYLPLGYKTDAALDYSILQQDSYRKLKVAS
jgi:hypothetical protein